MLESRGTLAVVSKITTVHPVTPGYKTSDEPRDWVTKRWKQCGSSPSD